ncbi:hypothetical protein [Streptomyces sp. AC555_RSS877]|uniref:hypothetical protein n=1 Tax=Streptomyces sp. AC555_RSS877 TaxID=2823688 RepID=UPI0020B799E3|nr:hypothetical protein [Streptomyces sp. AC555_RSS877]
MLRRTTACNSDVYAEFEGGGTGQGVDLPADELALDLRGLLVGPLRCVFLGSRRDGVEGEVEAAEVAAVRLVGGLVLLKAAGTAQCRADSPHRHGDHAAAAVTCVEGFAFHGDGPQPEPGMVEAADRADPGLTLPRQPVGEVSGAEVGP